MENRDAFLTALLAKVEKYPFPEDQPTLSGDLAEELRLPLQELLVLSKSLAEEGLIKISPLYNPPLLYLTFTGLARARRLKMMA